MHGIDRYILITSRMIPVFPLWSKLVGEKGVAGQTLAPMLLVPRLGDPGDGGWGGASQLGATPPRIQMGIVGQTDPDGDLGGGEGPQLGQQTLGQAANLAKAARDENIAKEAGPAGWRGQLDQILNGLYQPGLVESEDRRGLEESLGDAVPLHIDVEPVGEGVGIDLGVVLGGGGRPAILQAV